MINNYLKKFLSGSRKYRLMTLMCILGMVIGLTSCVSGNRAGFSAKGDLLFLERFPQQMKEFGRIYGNTPGLFTRGELSEFEDGFHFANNALFNVFDFEWLQGDPRTALLEPNTLVLTESLAEKYFPGENPMGQVIGLSPQKFPMTVVGVIRDLPDDNHLLITALASMDLGGYPLRQPQDILPGEPEFQNFIQLCGDEGRC